MILYRIESCPPERVRAGTCWRGYYSNGISHLADFRAGGIQPTIRVEEHFDQLFCIRGSKGKSYLSHMQFCFNSIEQLESWFPLWEEIVDTSGYRLRIMDVPDDCVITGKYQAVYDPAAVTDECFIGRDYDGPTLYDCAR